jgi:hypothetical protein
MAAALSSCASAGSAPQTFRFLSNLDAEAALRCAHNRLRIEGFEVTESADGAPPVALRRSASESEVGTTEWWRVEVTISSDDTGRTVVQSVASVGRRAEGPFTEPPVVLQGIVGKISASCTW